MQEQVGRAVARLGIAEGRARRAARPCPTPDASRSGGESRCAAGGAPGRAPPAPAWRWGSSGCRRRCAGTVWPARRPHPGAPARDRSPASASPPMPAPTMAKRALAVMDATSRRGSPAGQHCGRRAEELGRWQARNWASLLVCFRDTGNPRGSGKRVPDATGACCSVPAPWAPAGVEDRLRQPAALGGLELAERGGNQLGRLLEPGHAGKIVANVGKRLTNCPKIDQWDVPFRVKRALHPRFPRLLSRSRSGPLARSVQGHGGQTLIDVTRPEGSVMRV